MRLVRSYSNYFENLKHLRFLHSTEVVHNPDLSRLFWFPVMDTIVSDHPGRAEGELVALCALAKVYGVKGAALASRVGAEGDHVEQTNGSMKGSMPVDF